MLDDVMNLARLQAGQEQLETRRFDAAQLLQELCEELQEQANQRGLYLKWGGPESLMVEGDPVKTRRIAQNLLINAPDTHASAADGQLGRQQRMIRSAGCRCPTPAPVFMRPVRRWPAR